MKNGVFILSGSGLSQESGLKTFRDEDGLWEGYDVSQVATPQAFAANPKLVHEFYNQRRQQMRSFECQPNPGHAALALWQKKAPYPVHLITQNVDNLLERAGAKKVLHMHGELDLAQCVFCQSIERALDLLSEETACTQCKKTSALRPRIVWFGEIPLGLDQIQKGLEQADVFLSIGTSGQVYPAASFFSFAKESGAYTIEINYQRTDFSQLYDESYQVKAGEFLPQFVNEWLNQKQPGKRGEN